MSFWSASRRVADACQKCPKFPCSDRPIVRKFYVSIGKPIDRHKENQIRFVTCRRNGEETEAINKQPTPIPKPSLVRDFDIKSDFPLIDLSSGRIENVVNHTFLFRFGAFRFKHLEAYNYQDAS